MDRRSFTFGVGASLALAGCASRGAAGEAVSVSPDDPFIAELQERTFRWFWDVTSHETGLTPDRWPTHAFSSVTAIGFALTVYGVGAERGWITRDQALDRTLNTLRFLIALPQGAGERGVAGYRGFFYHFLQYETGERVGQVELSSVDTTLLLGGVLFAAGYFDRDDPREQEVRRRAEELYARVEWTWMRPRAPLVGMGWRPENGGSFIGDDWSTYDEGALVYLLGLGSPTHALPQGVWETRAENFDRQWSGRWGQPHLHFPPLFGHQFSHVWVDFRGIQDAYMRRRGIDYFENSRRAVYAQREYAIANPGGFRDYSAEIFGLSACDGPGDFTHVIDGRRREFYSYSARGPGDRDDGTLTPHALGGSIPFAPEVTVPALKEMRRRYGDAFYTEYGFLDAVNPTLTDPNVELQHGRVVEGVGWIDGDYLGLDQGPIVCMIENWRSGLIWNVMRKNPHLRRGLELAGFTGGWLEA